MPIVKDLMRVHLIKKCSYFCDIYFKMITGIMSHNIIPGHNRFPGISQNFWNTYMYTNIT